MQVYMTKLVNRKLLEENEGNILDILEKHNKFTIASKHILYFSQCMRKHTIHSENYIKTSTISL